VRVRWALCLPPQSLCFPVKRILVSAQRLRVLLIVEIATLEACRGVEVGEIEVSPRADADGCIWKARSCSMPEPGVLERARVEATPSAMR
jgi:hypothetical protein